ncbi:peptidoglycan-binding protein [Conexibacter sp. JD483]|uniref:glycoside hydrolase family protein n=1 Tax=unclassified Conexibacter TaxID=2627773 RepID=UPI00271A88C8|nr:MULTISPECIES: peptidoglycan-binding protein [unclassified Conexibacter]MDO8187204.1 peptidoglycan-binding protein [Conexibacter sp. CPCC 205706]MDO8199301.1 peptidoglycan-binding protein [Conexibacter sp. CPCC 205762]MDR9369298.1 peptidoglycan-binding protein [Conexibacter sp. JD483]
MTPSFDGHHVSDDWFKVLTAARRAGVSFRLNSGRRTLAEQQRLYDLYRAGVGNLAAVPSPTAPHIRVGRQDHALDVDVAFGGGVAVLRSWLRGHGLATSLTVAGEPWHVEADSAGELRAAAKRLGRKPTVLDRLRARPLTRGTRAPEVRAVLTYLRRARLISGSVDSAVYGATLERAVRTFQRRVGLVADGVVGPKTFAALRRRYGWRVWSRRAAAKPAAGTEAPPATLRISATGLDLIEQFEGFFARPYDDPAGHATVGYGHLLHLGPVTAADRAASWVARQQTPGQLTDAEARQLLRQQLAADYEPAVQALALPLTQGQHDALVSFVYNVGTGALASSTGIGRALRERRWVVAADELLRWDKAGVPPQPLPGLTRRRRAERARFLGIA